MADRISCIHRGAMTRNIPCGCPSGVNLYACMHPDTLFDECALMTDGGKRGAVIAELGLPTCRECKDRVPRPEKPKVVHEPFPQPDREPLPNRATELWLEQRKSRRKARRSQPDATLGRDS